jgi:hypothetical protein
MKLCPSCDRHLFGSDSTCPFCGAAQATTGARPGGAAMASITLAFVMATTACGPVVEPEQADTSSSSTDGPAPTTTMPPGTTMPPLTTGMVTDGADDPAMTTLGATTTDGDSTDDAPCAFYACPPDVGGAIECDVLVQDCPRGEKCMPWANDGGGTWNATRCSPLDDSPDAPGEPCTVEGSGTSGIDSCALGAMCFDVDPETNEGTCVELCSGTPADPQCDQADHACFIGNDGVLPLCLLTCDPLVATCPDGEACVPLADGFFCITTFGMPGAQGEPCLGAGTCDPGLVCLDGSVVLDCASTECCTAFCDTSGAPCPGADQGVTCQPWYEPGGAPPGLETLGACVLP